MRIAIAALALALAGCAAGGPEVKLTGRAEGGGLAYVGPLLGQARQDFFGGTGPSPGTGGGGGGAFGVAEPVRLAGFVPGAVSLGLTWEGGEAAGWHFRPGLALSRHVAHAELPQGLGIFTDPMDIDLVAHGVTGTLELQRDRVISPNWTAQYGAGIGLQRMFSHGHFQSALIDLKSDIAVTSPFAMIGAGLFNARGGGLEAEARYFGSDSAEYSLGLVQRF